ncbi:HD domain-containing phosphohydrolase [Vibrio hippocampi]|uniref:HD-GYP domain-containing protein n=1 Tax=Vibrio hippocampi TaxID=654686 RepID=A0ABN8DH99_9VIBR|nr:HD domain-containing phosphohydrolase [Vibrio hippocampi]CAH0525029.1 hypothetical protein VHP8226_00694 [Vibrio hippocampi]
MKKEMTNTQGYTTQPKIISVSNTLKQVHHDIVSQAPDVVRIAVALYDADTQELKTFADSTLQGKPLLRYSAPISSKSSLGKYVCRRKARVINDLQSGYQTPSSHQNWLIEQGYASSLTYPILHDGQLEGILFIDANSKQFFDKSSVDDLRHSTKAILNSVIQERGYIKSMTELGQSMRQTTLEQDKDSRSHAQRVGLYSGLIAERLGDIYQLSDEYIDHITHFATLHDIGKFSALSTNQSSIWHQDWDDRILVSGRVQQGLNLVNQLAQQIDDNQYACHDLLHSIIQHHHEYLDGSGLPNRLKHEQIPIAARIVTVANIFDALTSDRHYCESWSLIHALLELEKMVALGKLDGHCVHALRCQQAKIKPILESQPLAVH